MVGEGEVDHKPHPWPKQVGFCMLNLNTTKEVKGAPMKGFPMVRGQLAQAMATDSCWSSGYYPPSSSEISFPVPGFSDSLPCPPVAASITWSLPSKAGVTGQPRPQSSSFQEAQP